MYCTLWSNRKKISAGLAILHGIGYRAYKKNYVQDKSPKQALLGEVKFKNTNLRDRIKAGLFYENNALMWDQAVMDGAGAALISRAPISFIAAAGLFHIINGVSEFKRHRALKKVETTQHQIKLSEDNSKAWIQHLPHFLPHIKSRAFSLYDNKNEIGRVVQLITDKPTTHKKSMTLLVNHGSIGDYFHIWPRLIIALKKRLNQMQNPPLVNVVFVKQGHDIKLISSQIINYFNNNYPNNKFSILGNSAGTANSIVQSGLFKDKHQSVGKIILSSPVLDGMPMPASIRWLLKPAERLFFNLGLAKMLLIPHYWHWSIPENKKIPDKVKKNTLILTHKDDLFTKGRFLSHLERLHNLFPDIKIIQGSEPVKSPHNYFVDEYHKLDELSALFLPDRNG